MTSITLCMVFGLISLLILSLPAIRTTDGVVWGSELLALGWLGPLNLKFAWFANPAMMVVVVRVLHRRRVHWLIGLTLFALMADAMAWTGLPGESGRAEIIQYFGGYYIWLALVGLCACSPLLRWPDANPAKADLDRLSTPRPAR